MVFKMTGKKEIGASLGTPSAIDFKSTVGYLQPTHPINAFLCRNISRKV